MNSKTERRYGIFGGSFDPVHVGHLLIASAAIEELNLEKLYIVPAYLPPHKIGNSMADFEMRFRWLVKVFEKLDGAVVSSYERDKGGLSYSLLTVQHFIETEGEIPYFIVGEDSYGNLSTWYRYEELLKCVKLVIYHRMDADTRKNREMLTSGITVLDAPVIDLSSSLIRERINNKKSIFGMVPVEIISEVMAFYGES